MASNRFGGHGLILTGLLLGVLLAALDQTIVSTSLPQIARDLNGFELIASLITAYFLGSTIVVPIAGKFSDKVGRRPIYLAGMLTFLAGSMMCGLAGVWGDLAVGGVTLTGMNQLVLARFVQGLGGGAIFPVAIATIADLYSPAERGRVQGLFGAMFGLSSVIGPFIGGGIVDYVHVADISSWRWVFLVNLPVGAAGVFMVATHFPRKPTRDRAPIDWWGITAIITFLTSIVLATHWGGNEYAWDSPQILGLFALALTAVAAFVKFESRAKDPLIPLSLFREPIFSVSIIASLLLGACMFVVIAFMPTYMQGVVGISATYSGAVLMPLSLSLVTGSIVSGQLMKRFGYKPFIVAGAAITATGLGLLYLLASSGVPPIWLAILEMMYLGLGIGFTIQTFVVAVQNAVRRRYVGAASSSIVLFRQLGATIGIAALGALLNARMLVELPAQVAARPGAQAVYESALADPRIDGNVPRMGQLLVEQDFLDKAAEIPGGAAFIDALKIAFSESIAIVWITAAFIAIAGLLVALVLRSKPLKGKEEYAAEGAAEEAADAAAKAQAH